MDVGLYLLYKRPVFHSCTLPALGATDLLAFGGQNPAPPRPTGSLPLSSSSVSVLKLATCCLAGMGVPTASQGVSSLLPQDSRDGAQAGRVVCGALLPSELPHQPLFFKKDGLRFRWLRHAAQL